jgi:Cdc6-like AAA superfamily ATPase
MLQDQKLAQTVAAIPGRSERQQVLQKLVGAVVDVGILPQVRNHNLQVFYGRRGTGKTHILKVLASEREPGSRLWR